MCGVSVIVNKTGEVANHLIKAVNDKVAHRGPDDEGFYFGKNFAFAHRRLSILDLSSAGHQPMVWKHLLITYNGEIYNYIELREELKGKGYLFKTESDTEVILAAFEEWGTDAFAKFNGMWAFAIHDSNTNEIIFCRDHFGIKPLYYTKAGNYFLAGSEIKQFTACEDFIPELDKAVAVNFLISGSLNYSERTFFEGVQELRPGYYLRYNLDTHHVTIKQWYDLAKSSVMVHDSYEEAVKKVRSLLVDSVRIRMRSDVQVGSCLSGGIDSSSIVGIIHGEALANNDFATITSCYSDKNYDEQKFSDLITKQTGFRADKVYPNLNDLIDKGDLDTMIYHQDQPFNGASHYSEFNVFKKAREQGMIVMQDGQGADEFLSGYAEFYMKRIQELLKSFKFSKAIELIKTKARHRQVALVDELKRVSLSLFIYPFVVSLKKQISSSSYPWLSLQWQKIASAEAVNFKSDSIRELSIQEIETSSIPYQLHSEDRNSMLFSIESRLPFLDYRLVEYCIGLPSEYKIRNGYSKAVLRDAIFELPEVIKRRKDKMGFVAPDKNWILENKERVRQDLEEIIRFTSIFSPELLTHFDKFVKGELGYEPIYFRVMAFSRFCSIFKMRV